MSNKGPQKPPTVHQPLATMTPRLVNPMMGCQSQRDCNVVYGQGMNQCLSDHRCYCVKGSGQFCQYGPTFYKDPTDMTPRQLMRFKAHAKVHKMTLQDYINWLLLFEDDQNNLSPRHLVNLQKILQGRALTLEDIPRETLPSPMTAQEYFQKIANFDDRAMPRNMNTGGLQMPSNYGNYAQFETPRVLKHLNEQDPLLDLYKYNSRDAIEQTRPEISYSFDN